jgi:prepilin-type N-terminal cleavage/methylation domain-containing protein
MKRGQQGFTLIELAIVLVVLTILAGGLLVPLTKRIEAERIRSTQQTLEDAQQALIGYAMSHRAADNRPYLPCPDKMTVTNIVTNKPNDGLEDRTTGASPGPCEVQEGNFPWATLGIGTQMPGATASDTTYRQAIPTQTAAFIPAHPPLQLRFKYATNRVARLAASSPIRFRQSSFHLAIMDGAQSTATPPLALRRCCKPRQPVPMNWKTPMATITLSAVPPQRISMTRSSGFPRKSFLAVFAH